MSYEPTADDEQFLCEVDMGYIGLTKPQVAFVDYTQADYLPEDSGMTCGDKITEVEDGTV